MEIQVQLLRFLETFFLFFFLRIRRLRICVALCVAICPGKTFNFSALYAHFNQRVSLISPFKPFPFPPLCPPVAFLDAYLNKGFWQTNFKREMDSFMVETFIRKPEILV